MSTATTHRPQETGPPGVPVVRPIDGSVRSTERQSEFDHEHEVTRGDQARLLEVYEPLAASVDKILEILAQRQAVLQLETESVEDAPAPVLDGDLYLADYQPHLGTGEVMRCHMTLRVAWAKAREFWRLWRDLGSRPGVARDALIEANRAAIAACVELICRIRFELGAGRDVSEGEYPP
jgi:hypothetical protein